MDKAVSCIYPDTSTRPYWKTLNYYFFMDIQYVCIYWPIIKSYFRYINDLQKDGSNLNLIYSTPSCYVKAVHDSNKDREWPVKTDDFFPYGSDPHSFWTGYFTSRPTLKRFERMGNNFLQVNPR